MPIIARHLAIRGRVQGVCYRDWATRVAMTLGITGWIRNRTDGSVEALAMGAADTVDAFIARCRGGSPSARVDTLVVTEAEPEPLTGFERRPTA
ncbi:MAG TPA: acylphosphatase [Sphingomonas sp.]|nr:acylphosphatase [Sphingomonas sp.]